jgi:hypothetical protein
MKLDEVEKLSKKELRGRINNLFEEAEDPGLERSSPYSQAQFYMRELEHRRDSFTSIRDFILEIAVIGLIGWEIHMSYRAERLQSQNFENEQAVFTNLQASSAITAKTLESERQTMEAMNGAIHAELGLNYDVAVEITFDDPSKRIYVTNKGRTNISIWGTKTDTQKAVIEAKGRMIAPGGLYAFESEALYAEVQQKLPKGSDRMVPFVVFVKNENGNEVVIEAQLFCVWHNNVLTIHTQTMSVKREKWTGKDN